MTLIIINKVSNLIDIQLIFLKDVSLKTVAMIITKKMILVQNEEPFPHLLSGLNTITKDDCISEDHIIGLLNFNVLQSVGGHFKYWKGLNFYNGQKLGNYRSRRVCGYCL